jgi:hypothetical protein
MFDALLDKHPGMFIPVLAIVCTTVVFVVWIVVHNWRKARQLEVEAALKKDMLARQFTAADVERVLLATADRPEPVPDTKEAVSDNEYALVEKMLEEKYPVEEIERLVRAFRSGGKAPVPGDERIMA